jgi:hypothetical protein
LVLLLQVLEWPRHTQLLMMRLLHLLQEPDILKCCLLLLLLLQVLERAGYPQLLVQVPVGCGGNL